MEKPIVVRSDVDRRAYGVLASWRRPKQAALLKRVALWIPELAPSMALMRDYRKRRVDWKAFARRYEAELEMPELQNHLKSLALLSRRKNLVLLCDCMNGRDCPHHVLAHALRACRKGGDFAMRR